MPRPKIFPPVRSGFRSSIALRCYTTPPTKRRFFWAPLKRTRLVCHDTSRCVCGAGDKTHAISVTLRVRDKHLAYDSVPLAHAMIAAQASRPSICAVVLRYSPSTLCCRRKLPEPADGLSGWLRATTAYTQAESAIYLKKESRAVRVQGAAQQTPRHIRQIGEK